MAVKGSGELSMLNDIVAEFGGTAPHALSEYYGGGGLVPAGANPNVPASGQIRFNNMYNSIAATVLTISSNTNNYNIATAAQQAGGDLNTPVLLTVNSGVTVGSNSTGSPAMTTGTGWGAGTTINITNQGSIVGAAGSPSSGQAGVGGRGGQGGGGNTGGGQAGSAGSRTNGTGSNGGQAFVHAQPGSNLSVIFDTAGTRTGGSAGTFTAQGGGGGGGGGGRLYHNQSPVGWYGGGGGGGGARSGQGGGAGPGSIQGEPNYPPYRGQSGNAGGNTTGGNGGAGYGGGAGAGGRGGNLQSAGQAGQTGYPYSPGNPGGARANATSSTGTAGQALGGNTGYIS